MQTALSLLAVHIVGLAIYAAWAWPRVAHGATAWPYLLAIPLIYALLVLAITLADFALAWMWRSPRPASARIGARATVTMIAQEFWALLPSAARMMLYPLRTRLPAAGADALPVILVHGVLCNAGVWSTFATACARNGIAPVYRLSYEPTLESIETFAEQLAALIDIALTATGATRVAVVGHSMGGLVARAYIARHGSARVARVITLGTPYRGSNFARLMVGKCLAQIRPGSAWLAAMAPEVPAAPPFTSLWSWHDSMVAPQSSCALEGARNVELHGIGHNALLHDRRVVEQVMAELTAARATEPRALPAAADHGQAG